MRKYLSNYIPFMEKVPEDLRLPGIVDKNFKPHIPDPSIRAFADDECNSTLRISENPDIVTLHEQAMENLHPVEACTKTLGYRYNVKQDVLIFDQYANLHVLDKDPTMRTLASKLASLYDPLGLISAFILPARRLLAQCFVNSYTWTTKLPKESTIYLQFVSWLKQTKKLSQIRFPRFAPFDEHTHFAI